MNRIIKYTSLYLLITIGLNPFIVQQLGAQPYRMPKQSKTYKFDFDNKPLTEIINELAALKKINILLPQGAFAITARVTYHLQQPMSADDAWKLVSTLLAMNNYTIKPDGDMHMIVKTDTPNITREVFDIYIDVPPDKLPNTENFIQTLFYLQNLSVKNMQSDLQTLMQDMLSPNMPTVGNSPANIRFDPKTNAIILTDKAILIRNVMKIINELDQSGVRDAIEVMPLYYTSAQVVDDLFNKQLMQTGQPGMNGAGAGQPLPQASYFPRNTKIMALERTNSLVIMGTQHAIELVKDFIIKYIDRPLESGESILHVYELKYLTAKELAPVLQQILTPAAQTQAGGKLVGPKQYFKDVIVVAEITSATEQLTPTPPTSQETSKAQPTTQGVQPGGNRLIIAARKADWTRIKKLIDDLDKPQPQIALEVLVVDLTLETNKFLGSQIRNPGGFHDSLSKNVNFQSAQLSNPVLRGAGVTPDTDFTGIGPADLPANALMANLLQLASANVNLARQAIPGSLVIALKDTAVNTVWGLFFLLDSFANTTILAQPFLITQNHQQATVTIEQTRLLQMEADTSQAGVVPVEFQSESAGLTVDILPHIASIDNTINLQVSINVNEFTDDPQNVNNRITRVVETSATVGDGEILALGGLIRDRDILNVTKVPVLGDVPILGWFFKKEQKQRIKNNLLIFIAPKIIKPRLKGGIDPYACKKLEWAQNELDESLVFENLRDPITRWFFRPDPTLGRRTMDAFTHHSLHQHADVRHEEVLEQEPRFYAKNEGKKPPISGFAESAEKLKQLVQNEENPLSGIKQKQL
jgi:general secretion pathway protein D